MRVSDRVGNFWCREWQYVPIHMTMRPMKLPVRFVIAAALVVASASPAMAASRPDDLTPNLARQPVFHRSQASGTVLGSIRIPAIGLDETVRSGVAMAVIDQGVAHWSGTSLPGGAGNVVLAGHRTTNTRPFNKLDLLEVGDLVYMTDGTGFDVMYRVSSAYVVDPNDMWITYDRPTPTVTMFACHPKGSARFRIVVEAGLLAGRRIA
ncbi:MAG: class E sortase [Actinomycetota bacterium]